MGCNGDYNPSQNNSTVISFGDQPGDSVSWDKNPQFERTGFAQLSSAKPGFGT